MIRANELVIEKRQVLTKERYSYAIGECSAIDSTRTCEDESLRFGQPVSKQMVSGFHLFHYKPARTMAHEEGGASFNAAIFR